MDNVNDNKLLHVIWITESYSDQGKKFSSRMVQNYVGSSGVTQNQIPAYNQKSNALIEWVNHSLAEAMQLSLVQFFFH